MKVVGVVLSVSLLGLVVAIGPRAVATKGEIAGDSIMSAEVTIHPSPTSTPTSTPSPTATPTPTRTPTPTLIPSPSPTPFAYTGTDLDNWFTQYSNEYGIDRNLLHNIAQCESGFNASSYNKKYGYSGMYQFSESSWKSARMRMGVDTNLDLRFNPQEAIRTAAFKLSRDGAGAWPNCPK